MECVANKLLVVVVVLYILFKKMHKLAAPVYKPYSQKCEKKGSGLYTSNYNSFKKEFSQIFG